jgi:hypothetical protein
MPIAVQPYFTVCLSESLSIAVQPYVTFSIV